MRMRTPLELGATAAYHLEHWFISPIVMITRFHLDGQVSLVSALARNSTVCSPIFIMSHCEEGLYCPSIKELLYNGHQQLEPRCYFSQ